MVRCFSISQNLLLTLSTQVQYRASNLLGLTSAKTSARKRCKTLLQYSSKVFMKNLLSDVQWFLKNWKISTVKQKNKLCKYSIKLQLGMLVSYIMSNLKAKWAKSLIFLVLRMKRRVINSVRIFFSVITIPLPKSWATVSMWALMIWTWKSLVF